MSVVSDASVLIFLGKIRRLDWLKTLLRGPFYLSDLVKNEVLPKGVSPSEEEYLTQELSSWKIIPWHPRIARLGGGLSLADISVLEVAKKVGAQWVLADEKSLRQVLAARRHKVVGTLGLILMARRQTLISIVEAKEAVDDLVTSHRFRISAETYGTFLKLLS